MKKQNNVRALSVRNARENLPNCDPKTNKGITLIALIITIIVLLILAVVSIRLVVNNGILEKAEYATKKYTEEEAAEQEKLLKAEYEMAKYEGKTTGTYEEYVLDKMYGLKIGDYVNYDPTDGATTTSVTSYSAENGYGDQTFNLASYKNAGYGWRVLGIKDGKIQLISEEFIGPDSGGYTNSTYNRTYYYLRGQEGYINGIDELNKICAMYGQGKGAESARSITVEDVNNITGYKPEIAQYNKGYIYEYGNEVTYSWTSNNKVAYKGKYETEPKENGDTTFIYYDSATRSFKPLGTDESVTLKSTFYMYNPVTLTDKEYEEPVTGINEDGRYNTAFEMLFGSYKFTESNRYFRNFIGTGVPQSYWLASYFTNTNYGSVTFGLRKCFEGYIGYKGYDYNLCSSYGSTASDRNGVRPVVSLKSDIQLEYNSTAKEWKIK